MARRVPALAVLEDDDRPFAATVDDDTDYRELVEPRCVVCDRPESTHGTPMEIGGEQFTPACELVHPGGIMPYGPRQRTRRRSLRRRLEIAATLKVVEARAIASSLGGNTKMPGATYGLDAWKCKVGDKLASVKGSVCFGCYARRNFYKWYWPAVKARHLRQAAISHPLWAEAMIVLIRDFVRRGGERYFRWHDSGDLQSLDHLESIVDVARATAHVKHWLPTREYGIVAQYLREGGDIPSNLCIRLSAHYIGERPRVPAELLGLPTSTVHAEERAPVRGFGRVNASIECRAYTRDNSCGSCRACWTPGVQNVSYLAH